MSIPRFALIVFVTLGVYFLGFYVGYSAAPHQETVERMEKQYNWLNKRYTACRRQQEHIHEVIP